MDLFVTRARFHQTYLFALYSHAKNTDVVYDLCLVGVLCALERPCGWVKKESLTLAKASRVVKDLARDWAEAGFLCLRRMQTAPQDLFSPWYYVCSSWLLDFSARDTCALDATWPNFYCECIIYVRQFHRELRVERLHPQSYSFRLKMLFGYLGL